MPSLSRRLAAAGAARYALHIISAKITPAASHAVCPKENIPKPRERRPPSTRKKFDIISDILYSVCTPRVPMRAFRRNIRDFPGESC